MADRVPEMVCAAVLVIQSLELLPVSAESAAVLTVVVGATAALWTLVKTKSSNGRNKIVPLFVVADIFRVEIPVMPLRALLTVPEYPVMLTLLVEIRVLLES